MLKDVRSFVKSCPICQKLNEKGSDSHGEKFLVGVNNPGPTLRLQSTPLVPTQKIVWGISIFFV